MCRALEGRAAGQGVVPFVGPVPRSAGCQVVPERSVHAGRLRSVPPLPTGMEYLHNCKPVLVHRDLKR